MSNLLLNEPGAKKAIALRDFKNIPPAPKQDSYPLSSSQRRLWVLSQLEDANVAYNMPSVYHFEGALNQDALAFAFSSLVARHESLRTVFRQDEDGNVRQYIKPAAESGAVMKIRDLRGDAASAEKVEALVTEEVGAPFDLEKGPLIRAGLFQTEDDKWIFAGTMHHIVSDGWSMEVLIYELMLFYHAHIRKMRSVLPPLKFHYKDYAVWQQEQLEYGILHQQEVYWHNQLSGELPVLELQGDMPRPAVKTYNGAMLAGAYERDLSEKMAELCRKEGCTLFMGMLAVVNTLIYRYTGQQDILVGSPIAGREHSDLEGQIGFYVNTIVLRSRFDGLESFRTLLRHVRETTLYAFENQSYPFDRLVETLDLRHDLSRNPIFDVMVALQNADAGLKKKTRSIDGLKVVQYAAGDANAVAKFDLLFNFSEQSGQILFGIEYNTDIFKEDTIKAMTGHLQQIMEQVVNNDTDTPLEKLQLVNRAEKDSLMKMAAGPQLLYPEDATIISLFETQAQQTPAAHALKSGEAVLTYEILNRRSNRLAHYLRQQFDVQPGELVGVQLPRNEWLVTALLAVLKSGAAYVPVDPAYPAERIEYILADSRCRVHITPEWMEEYLQVNENELSAENPPALATTGNPAYLIYTSGSTGRPKGVVIEHGNVSAFLHWSIQEFGHADVNTVLAVTSVCFDLSIFEIFFTLCTGRTVWLLDDGLAVPQALESGGRVLLNTVPSVVGTLISAQTDLSNIALLNMAGEPVPPTFMNTLGRYNMEVRNLYGPSEDTTYSTVYRLKRGEPVLIGRPVAGTDIYILNQAGLLQPVGVPGEICIGGRGLARGYLNQPGLTAQKFVPHPFRNNDRMYRTGDKGRWLPDGNIEYLGRIDEQVKIRGYRIEPGEIEAALLRHEAVEAALVTARLMINGQKELVAYIVAKGEPGTAALRNWLGALLPAYMVPGFFVQIPSFPLNANGKINRAALPAPETGGMGPEAEMVAPRNTTEEALAAIWSEVLGREQVSMSGNFFNLGGHSLKATMLVAKIFREFDVKISLKDIFAHPVLEQQALLIDQSAGASFAAIEPAPPQDAYPLSKSQWRLWVLSQFERASVAYNMPGVYMLEGNLDTKALQLACHALIERHEILRTRFIQSQNGIVLQHIVTADSLDFKINVHDLHGQPNPAGQAQDMLAHLFGEPFNLAQGPLLKVAVYRIDEKLWALGFVMHHIISDGWSMNIVFTEMMHLYNAFRNHTAPALPALRIQYKDYAVWQYRQFEGDAMERHRQYWMQQLGGELPVLELPCDERRPAVQSFSGSTVSGSFSKEASARLYLACRQQQATIFMGLMAVLKTMLYRYSGQSDIVLGTVIAGREHADLENQIGFYINTLALRTRFSGSDHFENLLDNIRQITLDAYEHQAYPFDKLVEELNLLRDLSRSPVFDVMMVLQNTGMGSDGGHQMDDIKIMPFPAKENPVSKFDLTFSFAEADEQIWFAIEYSTDIFHRETVEQMARHLEQLADAITAAPHTALQDIDYLKSGETERLLNGNNSNTPWLPPGPLVVQRLEAHAAERPLHPAIVFNENTLTWQQMNSRVNQLANWLRQRHQAQPDQLIAIKMERSEKMVISKLAVLKSGAGYLPVDPGYPAERIEYLLSDSGSRLVIDETVYAQFEQEAADYSSENPVFITQPGHLAYVIYTSGSTGKPKGVMITHKNLSSLASQALAFFAPQPVTMPLLSSSAFDASIIEIFIPLLSGGTLQVLTGPQSGDMAQKAAVFSRSDTIFTVPAAMEQLVWYLKSSQVVFNYTHIRNIFMGGDVTPELLFDNIQEIFPNAAWHNLYGPTEATVYITCKKYEPHTPLQQFRSSYLGEPVANTRLYILDAQGKLVPPGVVGELHAGGDRIARGYLNKPELTREKFIPNPWVEGDRLYKTGDAARWLHNGGIEFMGRIDEQVKIRGFRIETGEVETALLRHPDVEIAVVVPILNRQHEKELAAYIKAKRQLSSGELRSHLTAILPEYMVPGHFVQLDVFPLTPSGKTDRKALPPPEGQAMHTGTAYVAPGNEAEEKLLAIWQDFLNRSQIGVQDNFFDLGGNSMTIAKMVPRISTEFGKAISVVILFQYPSIETLAAYLTGTQHTTTSDAEIQEGINIMEQTLNLLK